MPLKRFSFILFFLLFTSCSGFQTKTLTPTDTIPAPTVIKPSATVTHTPTSLPTSTPSPTPLPPVPEQLALGDNHTCHLHSTGRVSCWGWNQFGQSGQPQEQTSIQESVVPTLEGITSITAGAYHTCAVNWLGQVYCWGRNNNGQLGDTTTYDSSIPVLVIGLDGQRIVQISAGSMHTCALDANGSVYCWGSNRDGKLASSLDQFMIPQATKVEGLPTLISSIAAGSSHTCVLDKESNLWCWGEGTFGQIGLNPFKNSAVPVKAFSFSTMVTSIQAGWFHTCLLTIDGLVSCWGKNQEGQLGNAALISRADPVTPVGMGKDIKVLSVGGQEACVIKQDNSVFCWGKNNYGQIGDVTTKDRLIPEEISLPEKVTQIYVGGSHACAMAETGTIYCWGANDLGQTGQYSINSLPTPTPTTEKTVKP